MDCARDSRGYHGLQHNVCGCTSCRKTAGKHIESNSPAPWLHLSWFMFGCWGFLSTAQMIPRKWLSTCFLPSISSFPNSYNSYKMRQKTIITVTKTVIHPCVHFHYEMAWPMFPFQGHFSNKRRHFVRTFFWSTMPFCKKRVFCWANHFVRANFLYKMNSGPIMS